MLAQISAGFLAVAVTVVALVPTLVEITHTRSATFLSQEDARDRLYAGLSILSHTIWLFGLVTFGSILLMYWPCIYLVIADLLLFLVSLVLLIYASYDMATMIHNR
jgi:hypothetical protein